MSDRQRDPGAGPAAQALDDPTLAALSQYSRGDRPLTLLDQMERSSLDLDLAAWLVSHVSAGASFIVGAAPGNAGKTTTMRALLSFAPADLAFLEALPGKLAGLDGRPACVVSHELSSHGLPAYLWDQDLRDFFALHGRGHMLAANLHADDLAGAHHQICAQCGVPEDQFRAVDLYLVLGVAGDGDDRRRWIESVWHSPGSSAHTMVFARDRGLLPGAPRLPDREESCR
ncbi:MAG: hypothetical protein ABIL09_16740, partial [Gemmatimonadota bacterium]